MSKKYLAKRVEEYVFMDMKNLGRTPITTEQPAGSDVSYNDDYQELVAEIKKLSSPTSDSVIDWSSVTRLCVGILENESKNILVACFLSVSLVRSEGLKGCVVGVHVLRDMVEEFWDSLYPPKKRKKGRINALVWWNDNLKKLLEGVESELWEAKERQNLLDDISFIDKAINENLPDGPMLRPLINLISSKIMEQVEEITEPLNEGDMGGAAVVSEMVPVQDVVPTVTAVKPPASDSVTEPMAQPPTGNSSDDVDAVSFLVTGRDFLLQTAKKFFAQDHENPASYQLRRLVAWSPVDIVPPATNSETMLSPPDDQLVSLLESQYKSKNWSELLLSAEGNIRQYLFWIDLSFWVATSLKELGATEASKSVAFETRNYVKKIKGVENLSFQGGIPFAGAATKVWLREKPDTEAPVQLSPTQATVESEFTHCVTKALTLIGADGPEKAILFFQSTFKETGTGKAQFFRDLGLCSIMLTAGKMDLALPFAERVLHVIKKKGIEEWEPELAATALVTMYNVYSQQPGEQYTEILKQIINQITLIAPERVLSLV